MNEHISFSSSYRSDVSWGPAQLFQASWFLKEILLDGKKVASFQPFSQNPGVGMFALFVCVLLSKKLAESWKVFGSSFKEIDLLLK